MSMLYADCLALIRDRLQASDTGTLADAAVERTFDSVYRQWYKRFTNRSVTLPAGAAGGSTVNTVYFVGGATTSQRSAYIADTDIFEVVSAHVCLLTSYQESSVITAAKAIRPGEIAVSSGFETLYTVPLDRIPVDEMRELYAQYDAGAYPAAGLGITAGTPALFSVDWRQDDTDADSGAGAWHFTVFPPLSLVRGATFPMVVRKFPPAASGLGATALECDDDEAVGLCAIAALRLMPAVGKQNDQGLVQSLVAEIPEEMQVMAFAPRVEDSRIPFTAERPV